MLSDDIIRATWLEGQIMPPRGGKIVGEAKVMRFARAIESAVRAEYADVPPEKFKGLYRAIQPVVDYAGAYGSIEARGDRMQAVMDALYSIDNGTYSPKIGGE